VQTSVAFLLRRHITIASATQTPQSEPSRRGAREGDRKREGGKGSAAKGEEGETRWRDRCRSKSDPLCMKAIGRDWKKAKRDLNSPRAVEGRGEEGRQWGFVRPLHHPTDSVNPLRPAPEPPIASQGVDGRTRRRKEGEEEKAVSRWRKREGD
jgi:hypothetical protein